MSTGALIAESIEIADEQQREGVDATSPADITRQQHGAKPRQQWGNRLAFILASMGCAIGFGNFFRFPFLVAKNGGASFLIPFLAALVLIGLPLLTMEYALGQITRSGPVESFKKLNRRTGGVGLAAVIFGSFIIVTYYTTFLAWIAVYVVYTFNYELPWTENPQSFFDNVVLQKSTGVLDFTGVSWPVFFGLAFCWFIIFLCVFRGTHSVGVIAYLTVPLPFVLVGIMFVRALFLEGAFSGFSYLTSPQLDKLLDPDVWLQAVGQIFFSLSVAHGIQIAYGSFKASHEDPNVDSIVVGLSDAGFSIFCAIVMFMLLGHIAHESQLPFDTVASRSGLSLGFIVLSSATSILPAPHLLAIWLWVTMFSLGIDSAFGLIDAMNALIHDKWPRLKLWQVSIVTCTLGFLLGIPYTLKNGYYLLNIVDTYVNKICLVMIGLAQTIVIGYMIAERPLVEKVREAMASRQAFATGSEKAKHVLQIIRTVVFHSVDDFRVQIQKLSKIRAPFPDWSLLVKYAIPAVLIFLLGDQIRTIVTKFVSDCSGGTCTNWLELVIALLLATSCFLTFFSGILTPKPVSQAPTGQALEQVELAFLDDTSPESIGSPKADEGTFAVGTPLSDTAAVEGVERPQDQQV